MKDIPSSMDDFVNEKPVLALVEINRQDEIYGTAVSRVIDTTYAHTTKLIGMLVDEGYVRKEKDGRKQMLDTTESGQRLAEKWEELINEYIEVQGNS